MDTVKTLNTRATNLPVPVISPETRAALDSFFRSFGFTTDDDLSRLAQWVLGALGADPRQALTLARTRMLNWLAGALGPSHAGSSLLTRGRAAFVLCDGARRGADILISGPDALPEDFVRALRASVPVPAPKPLPTTMPEQQLVLWPLGELFRRWWRAGEPDVSVSR